MGSAAAIAVAGGPVIPMKYGASRVMAPFPSQRSQVEDEKRFKAASTQGLPLTLALCAPCSFPVHWFCSKSSSTLLELFSSSV